MKPNDNETFNNHDDIDVSNGIDWTKTLEDKMKEKILIGLIALTLTALVATIILMPAIVW